jgi:hypothetical protein
MYQLPHVIESEPLCSAALMRSHSCAIVISNGGAAPFAMVRQVAVLMKCNHPLAS